MLRTVRVTLLATVLVVSGCTAAEEPAPAPAPSTGADILGFPAGSTTAAQPTPAPSTVASTAPQPGYPDVALNRSGLYAPFLPGSDDVAPGSAVTVVDEVARRVFHEELAGVSGVATTTPGCVPLNPFARAEDIAVGTVQPPGAVAAVVVVVGASSAGVDALVPTTGCRDVEVATLPRDNFSDAGTRRWSLALPATVAADASTATTVVHTSDVSETGFSRVALTLTLAAQLGGTVVLVRSTSVDGSGLDRPTMEQLLDDTVRRVSGG